MSCVAGYFDLWEDLSELPEQENKPDLSKPSKNKRLRLSRKTKALLTLPLWLTLGAFAMFLFALADMEDWIKRQKKKRN